MEFKVQKEVLDSGVKIVFAAVEGMDNHGMNDEWQAYAPNALLSCIILILNQPIDKSSAEISPFFVKLPCRATSPPAVAFLDWSYFICRLCL